MNCSWKTHSRQNIYNGKGNRFVLFTRDGVTQLTSLYTTDEWSLFATRESYLLWPSVRGLLMQSLLFNPKIYRLVGRAAELTKY